MLTRIAFLCLFVILASSCASPGTQDLPISTPQASPETATATLAAVQPSPTVTLSPTAVPSDAISSDNLKQVRLLHQYWLTVANAAAVDPYQMSISALATSPDGKLIAVGGCSKPLEADLRSDNLYCNGVNSQNPDGVPFLIILDADTEDVIGTIPENQHDTTIADLAFTHDGKKLIYAIQPNKFAVWDIASAKIESVLWDGETSAPRIGVSPDDKWFAFKTTDHVQIWDTTSGKFVAEMPAFYRPQFSVDGKQILTNQGGEFVLYETNTWTELERFKIPCDCVYALSPDLSLLAASERIPTENAPILLWDVTTGEQLQSIEGTKGVTSFLAFTPDGSMLWRAGEHGDLTAWSTSDWQMLAENIGTFVPIINLRGFQFIDDGRHYLIFSDQHLGLYGLP